MENVVVHIISHSHWDREWYLPFESHRMQLVELFDNLFDLFENDPEFKSFHLDEVGQKVSSKSNHTVIPVLNIIKLKETLCGF